MLVNSGKVVASIIENESQLIGGPKAEGKVGDFIIYNNKVGFVIAGVRPASGMNPLGGVIEDAGLIRNGSDGAFWWNLMGDAPLVLFKGSDPLFSGRLFAPMKATILKDGSDGEAIVRIYGRDAEFGMRQEVTGVNSSSLKAKIMFDYILKPDSNMLETKVTLVNDEAKNKSVGIGNIFIMGDGANLFLPGKGFDMDRIEGNDYSYVAADAGPGVVSYAWYTSESDIRMHAKIGKPIVSKIGYVKAEGNSEGSISIYLFVGEGNVAPLYKDILAHRGITETGVVKGKCVSAGGKPVSGGASVTILNENGEPLNRVYTAADGSYELTMKPGKYLAQAWSYERDIPQPVSVEIKNGETVEANFTMDDPAVLEYGVTDGTGAPIPATISLVRKEKPSVPDKDIRFFVEDYNGGFYKTEFTITGGGKIAARPGDYTVYVSRGLEYEYFTKEVTLKEGATESISASIAQVIDTTGFLSSDFHIHSAPSFDTQDKISEKVLGIVAAGLDIPIATDHNRRTDYGPDIMKLGLQKEVKSVVGNEITTMRLGHFNVFPVLYRPDAPNEGAVEYLGRNMPEVFKDARDDWDKRTILQLNHPRALAGGYLGFVGYTPDDGKVKDPDNFTFEFDAIEVLNGSLYDDMKDVVIDWFSFLNHGMKTAGTGNTDSHHVFSLQMGCPRNYVKSPTDIPGDMVESEFVESILGQHITVSGGPFVKTLINGKAEMGDTITDTDGSVELKVVAQAPSWIEFEKIYIYANGEEILTEETPLADAPVRYEKTFTFSPTVDTWYIVKVEGDKDMYPVYPGKRPISFTNPIYVDVDGNGKFDPLYSFEN